MVEHGRKIGVLFDDAVFQGERIFAAGENSEARDRGKRVRAEMSEISGYPRTCSHEPLAFTLYNRGKARGFRMCRMGRIPNLRLRR